MVEPHGHMTLIDGSHVPLTSEAAAAIWDAVEAEDERALIAQCDENERIAFDAELKRHAAMGEDR